MNTNDLNARPSLTRRQRRSQAPRVECLESRELLTYPIAGVNFLIFQAVVHHQNTAFQVINGVHNSLRSDLTSGPLTTLLATPTTSPTFVTAAANFVITETAVVNNYEANAEAQLLPRFPFVYGQINNNLGRVYFGVNAQYLAFVNGGETAAQFATNVAAIVSA